MPMDTEGAGRKSRLNEELSQPNMCALDAEWICKQKWEKSKSSATRIMQQNDGRRRRVSWIRKIRVDLRLLKFLSLGKHLTHLAKESSNKSRISSGQDRLKILPEISHRDTET